MLNELYTALSKAQAEMGTAQMNRKNPRFNSKYSDMVALVEASRPALTKYGLCVTQLVEIDETSGLQIFCTRLGHTSGQYLESKIKLTPEKSDIQTLGSYITYLKRYAYAAILCLTDGEDDDGEHVMIRQTPVYTEQYVTKEQIEELEDELKTHPSIAEEMMVKMGISRLADLPKSKYLATLKRIREIKSLVTK